MVAEAGPRVKVELMEGAQSDFFVSKARHPAFLAGRRGGKTVGGVVKGFSYCFEYPGALGCAVAPTFPNVRDVVLRTIEALFGALRGREWEFRAGDMEIVFPGRVDRGMASRILLRSAESYDTLRGLTLAWGWLDEAGLQPEQVMLILMPSLTQQGYPQQGWVTSTPSGKRHWLHRVWGEKKGLDGEALWGEDYPVFRARTVENFHNPPGMYEHLKRQYGGTRFAAQELEGEFVIFEGQGFPQFSDKIHVRYPPTGMRFLRKVVGMDYGSVSPTALIEVGKDEAGRLWALREFYKPRCDPSELVKTLGEWQVSRVVCDPTAKDTIEALKRAGVPVKKAKTNEFKRKTGVAGARLALQGGEPGCFFSPECPNLIAEFGSLRYAQPRGAEMLTDKWDASSADHAFDAWVYALMDFEGAVGRPQAPFALIERGW